MDLLVILSAFMALGGVILHHNAQVWFELASAFGLDFWLCVAQSSKCLSEKPLNGRNPAPPGVGF